MSPARVIAHQILLLVERGGWAGELLRSRTAGLEARDAALAHELVYGCLRLQARLDYLIGQAARRSAASLDPEVRQALRLGLYQLLYMDRVPAHAAVWESVELVKRAGKASAASLVNAVLRRTGKEPAAWPDAATELSMPVWLLERWRRHYGEPIAHDIARAFLKPPEIFVRIPSGMPPPGATVEPTEIAGCFRWIGGDRGGLKIQDISSQSIVPLLDLQPGLTMLDLCAAPGNKTAQALEYGVRVVACDRNYRRLAEMKPLGCMLVALDGEISLPFRARFDRILLDAPCSGTGTLGRNPEIKWRLKPEDLAELQARQVRLLRNALQVLEPGGRLVYSTCSLEPEENEQVLEQVLGRRPEKILRRIPGRDAGDGFFAAVIVST